MRRFAPGSPIGSSSSGSVSIADARGRPLFARSLLIERLARDAVRKPLHDQRSIHHDRQEIRRHFHVVAEQLSLRDLQIGPEHLREVRHARRSPLGSTRSPSRRASSSACSCFTSIGRGASAACCRAVATVVTPIRGPASSLHHFLRALVVSQPQIHGMPQLAIVGPLGELHLRDEIGAHPVSRFVGLQRRRERRFRYLAGLQQRPDPRELFLIESGAGVADVLQVPGLVDAEQQRAEVLHASAAAPSSRRSRIPARGRP